MTKVKVQMHRIYSSTCPFSSTYSRYIMDRNSNPFHVSEADILGAIAEGLKEPIDPIEEVTVPSTLIKEEEMKKKLSAAKPSWIPPRPEVEIASKNNPFGIAQRMLNNGIRVNMVTVKAEPQRVAVRLYVPGGRMLEKKGKGGCRAPKTIFKNGEKKTTPHAWDLVDPVNLPKTLDWGNMNGTNFLSWNKN